MYQSNSKSFCWFCCKFGFLGNHAFLLLIVWRENRKSGWCYILRFLRLCDQYSQIESDVKSKVGEMIYKDRRGENSHFTVNFAFHRALPEAEVDFAKYFELKILKNMKPLCTHDEFSQQKRSIIWRSLAWFHTTLGQFWKFFYKFFSHSK